MDNLALMLGSADDHDGSLISAHEVCRKFQIPRNALTRVMESEHIIQVQHPENLPGVWYLKKSIRQCGELYRCAERHNAAREETLLDVKSLATVLLPEIPVEGVRLVLERYNAFQGEGKLTDLELEQVLEQSCHEVGVDKVVYR